MRRLWRALPGPTPVRLLVAVVLVVIALGALVVLFEWAGGFLDSGGAIAA